MRSSYLVCYDILDDKRLRKVFQLMRGFGDHLQFSIFECQFTPSDLVRCREALREVIHHDDDQRRCHWQTCGPACGLQARFQLCAHSDSIRGEFTAASLKPGPKQPSSGASRSYPR
jgi:CRISPR/Cas system-associated endoribonuclease Cas2